MFFVFFQKCKHGNYYSCSWAGGGGVLPSLFPDVIMITGHQGRGW